MPCAEGVKALNVKIKVFSILSRRRWTAIRPVTNIISFAWWSPSKKNFIELSERKQHSKKPSSAANPRTRRSRKLPARRSGQLLFRQRFPELNAVAVQVHDPTKSSVVVFLDLRVDPDAFITQSLQRRPEIVHDVVHHCGCFALAKICRCRRKNVPRREIAFGRAVCLSPGEHGPSIALTNNAYMLGIPGAEGPWIFGFEKNSADATNTCHGPYATRPFPWNQ